jgi:hypothetical protein
LEVIDDGIIDDWMVLFYGDMSWKDYVIGMVCLLF